MNFNEEKYAVAYMRYSSDNQTENSIEYQRAGIEDYAKRKGYIIIQEYVDEALTGKYDKRPSFNKMIDDALKKPSWDTILVYDMSRFFRNNSKAVNYTNLLRDTDIKLISVTEDYGDTRAGRMVLGMINLINEDASLFNSEHTHAGMKVKALEGVHCGGVPPLGYDVDVNQRLCINEEEAEIVRLIFSMVEQNYSYSKIASYLNENGYRKKNEKPFTKNSFSSILHQEKYVGINSWNKTRHENSKGKRNSHAYKPLEEQVRIEDGCPAIITKEQYQRVQEIMSSRNKGIATSKTRHHYMLSGLKILKCAECGSYMIGAMRQSHGRRYAVYYCPKHKKKECSVKEIPVRNLDIMIAKKLANDLAHRTDLHHISRVIKSDDTAQKLYHRLQGNEKSTANIVKAITKNYDEFLSNKLKALAEERAWLKKEIEHHQNNLKSIDDETILPIAKKFIKVLIESDDPDVRAYLSKNIGEILIDNENIKVTLVEN